MSRSFQLILQKLDSNKFEGLLKQFYAGKPLTPSQINLLRRFYYRLGSKFNPLLNDYAHVLKPAEHNNNSLLLTSNNNSTASYDTDLAAQNILHTLPYPLNLLPYRRKGTGLEYELNPAAFQNVRQSLQDIDDLIIWRGNQLLSGAPFYPGAIPHVNFFQWGNLYGVVKYQELPEEKALKANLLIYFEDKADRNIHQFANQYSQQHLVPALSNQNIIVSPTLSTPSPHLLYPHTPRLDLRPY